ncbi:hypothetical protein HanIR_Chr08g0374351 [Helianthus annuus]|nr:hypothetical protein HanIR_Chr08g0374351 [Helianthus annuus]
MNDWLSHIFNKTFEHLIDVCSFDCMCRLQQYKVVEMKLLAQQRDLQAKIPNIEKCLDVIATLQAKKDNDEVLLQAMAIQADWIMWYYLK